MKLELLNEKSQNSILSHEVGLEYASKFDSVSYDANSGRTFTIIGYNYDENGILAYEDSKKFSY